MGNQVVSASPKNMKFTYNFPVTNGVLNAKFSPDVNCYIHSLVLTNISSVSGIAVNDNLTAKTTYSFLVTKTNTNLVASITIVCKLKTDLSYSSNVIDTNVSNQGTHALFLHPTTSQITVYDLVNKVIDSNYISANTWTNDPKTVINLPAITGTWNCGFVEPTQNVAYLFGGAASSNKLELCKYYFSGSKAGQIWDISDTTQNTKTQIALSQNWGSGQWHVGYNVFTGKLYLVDQNSRLYISYISNMLSWNLILTWGLIAIGASDFSFRKTSLNYDLNKFCFYICYQGDDLERTYNHYTGSGEKAVYDNISGLTIVSNSSVTGVTFFDKSTLVSKTFTGIANTYKSTVIICASARRAMLATGNGTYSTYPKQVCIYNLAANTVYSESIFNYTDTTNCLDADYCNAIDKWVVLSDGTASTVQGRRTVFFLKPVYPGSGSIVAFEDRLSADARYILVNRQRY